MKKWRCRSCNGVYQDSQDDGLDYYHVCPPSRANPGEQIVWRPDGRDENVAMDEQGRALGRIKAEGRGREVAG